MGSGCKSV